MKDTYYFSHDYNTRTDAKIKRLLSKHGMLGYGVFWSIIEDLYNNANALPTDYESIAFDLRTSENIIKSIVLDFDLFIIENKVFGSLAVQKRIDARNEKSTKARESAIKRWEQKENYANALQSQTEGNAINESKSKESKEKEIKFNPTNFLLENMADSNLIKEWFVVRKLKKLSNTKTALEDFIIEINKSNMTINEVLKHCIVKGWGGFKYSWILNELKQNQKELKNTTIPSRNILNGKNYD